MTWLTWRQFRVQAIAAAVCLAVLAVVFVYAGRHLAHLYAVSGVPGCHGDCDALITKFFSTAAQDPVNAPLFVAGAVLLVILPAIVGAFWGAPLVSRELEAGTFKLAWNQDVTRTRWLLVKLSLVGLAVAVTAGIFSLLFTWFASPVDAAGGFPVNASQLSRLSPQMFVDRGIVPVGWAVFAFTLGVTLGAFIRRTIPAMAVTIAVVAIASILWPAHVRAHLLTPAHASAVLTAKVIGADMFPGREGQMTVSVGQTGSPLQLKGAWVITNTTVTRSGQQFTLPQVAVCQGNGFGQPPCDNYIAREHLTQEVSYVRASQFWPLQWYESTILLVLSLGLGALCAWRVRRLLT